MTVALFDRRMKCIKAFAGKTIKMVDFTASNVWYFYFTDGTNACIKYEDYGYGNPFSLMAFVYDEKRNVHLPIQ